MLTNQLNQENVVSSHDGILLSRENKILTFEEKWLELETSVLSETSQTQRDSCHAFSDMWKHGTGVIVSSMQFSLTYTMHLTGLCDHCLAACIL